MIVVGKNTKFTEQVQRFIKTGKNENEGKQKPSKEQVDAAITEFFSKEKEVAEDVLKSLSNVATKS